MRVPDFLHLFLLTSILFVTSCSWISSAPTPKARDFDIEKLLIAVSAFPSGWYVEWNPSHRTSDSRGQLNGRYVQFRSEDSLAWAMHTVYLYRDDQAASYWYREYLPFGSAERLTPWEIPSELQYQSQIADQFRFACADFRQESGGGLKRLRVCLAAGQYDEYVSIFSISMSLDDMAEIMSYSDLAHILKAIDARMAHYLKKESK